MKQNNEEIKITVYMFLWEALNRASNLPDFENRYFKGLLNSEFYKNEEKRQLVLDVTQDFFRAQGIEASLFQTNEKVILNKKIINYKENLFVRFFVNKLDKNPLELKRVGDRKDLYFLYTDSVYRLMEECGANIISEQDRNEVIKHAIRKTFSLGDRDAVFFCGTKIHIKYFTLTQVCDGKERRYNGLPEDMMCELYNKREKNDYKLFFHKLAAQALSKELDLSTIDNLFFHKNYIRVFQEKIRRAFRKEIEEEQVLDGFANYVLRAHFSQIAQEAARHLLKLVLQKDENAKRFLSFYDGGELIVDNQKLGKPSIIINKERWGLPAIYNLLQQLDNAKQNFNEKKKEIAKIQTSIDKKKKQIINLGKERSAIEKAFEDVNKESQEVHEMLHKRREAYQEMQLELKNRTGKNMEELQKKLATLQEELRAITKLDTELLNTRNNASEELEKMIIKEDGIKKDILTYAGNLENETQKAEILKESITPLLLKEETLINALANALMTFRVP